MQNSVLTADTVQGRADWLCCRMYVHAGMIWQDIMEYTAHVQRQAQLCMQASTCWPGNR